MHEEMENALMIADEGLADMDELAADTVNLLIARNAISESDKKACHERALAIAGHESENEFTLDRDYYCRFYNEVIIAARQKMIAPLKYNISNKDAETMELATQILRACQEFRSGMIEIRARMTEDQSFLFHLILMVSDASWKAGLVSGLFTRLGNPEIRAMIERLEAGGRTRAKQKRAAAEKWEKPALQIAQAYRRDNPHASQEDVAEKIQDKVAGAPAKSRQITRVISRWEGAGLLPCRISPLSTKPA